MSSGSAISLGSGNPGNGLVYDYNNSGWTPAALWWGTKAPYYSEIEASTTGAGSLDCGKDWTRDDTKALVIDFFGDPNNDVSTSKEKMYVVIEDGDGSDANAIVRYGDNGEDMNDIKKQRWQQWNIDLADFTGVNLQQIKKVYIGFGDSSDPVPGGAGIVYFDAIRLYVPRCVTEFGRLEADLNDDCVVDFKDVRIMALVWLDIDRVEVSPPDRAGLLVEYTFDNGPNDFNDTSGNDYHAVSHGSYPHTYTVDGNLVLSGEHIYVDLSYVDIPLGADNPLGGTGNYSIQITFRSTNGPGFLLTSAHPIRGGDEDNSLAFYTQERQGWENLTPVVHILHRGELDQESVVDFNDRMHTIVVTYDALTGTMCYYDDGFQDRTWKVRYGMAWYDEHVVRIGGCGSRGARNEFPVKDNLIGEIDSFRIYNYVLSAPEVMYLATNGTGVRPIVSRANLYNQELPGSRAVNFKDFAVLVDAWLEKLYWP